MKKHAPLLIATVLTLIVHQLISFPPMERLLQIPSGYLAAFFLGAPASFDGEVVLITTHPLLTVSPACSGVRLFAILVGLGGGYWCARRIFRWLALLPACYLITLFSNSARITAAWHFRHVSKHLIPDWLQEFAHMGIGAVWSLTIISLLIFWITRPSQPVEEPPR